MRIVFLGSGAFGLPTLDALAREHEVALVVTQPDRKAGRGGKLTPTPVGEWAASEDLPLIKPERVNEVSVVEQIRSTPADAWVVIAFGQKLGKALLADRFAVNLHASRLPRWRGAAPINAAILAGDATTGNSVITLADRMDAGLVLAQSERPIEATQTAGELHDLLAADGPGLVLQVLSDHATGSAQTVQQDEALVTLAPKLSRADAWIDPADTAEACRRRINGLSPWPGVQAVLGGVQLKLLRAQAEESDAMTSQPGSLLDPATGRFACGRGVLQLLQVQPAGKRPMGWTDFARGRPLKPGTLLEPVGGPDAC